MDLRVGLKIFLCWCLLTYCVSASSNSDELFITVDGIDYAVELHRSNFIDSITVNSNLLEEKDTEALEIYQGTVIDIPDSWVAASYHDGNWQGLASVYDKLYTLKNAGVSANALAVVADNQPVSIQATEIDLNSRDFNMAEMCAVQHAETGSNQSALASVLPNAANVGSTGQNPVAFSVGGITTAVNVVLALDQFHTSQYGADSVPRAIRILNNVDAIYRNSLGIALNNTAIVSYDDANPIFGIETDANILLNQLRLQQANIFGNSQRTLGSVLTFRNLQVAGMNGVAGIAFTSSTCSSFAVSVNEDRAVNNEGLSSIVLAHEMGHNFGANHDGPNPNPANAACPGGLNIMSPVVTSNVSSFSSCSRTEIDAHIANGSCYRQPIDIALSRFGAAPEDNLTQQQVITRQIAVNNNGAATLSNVVIEGEIDNAEFSRFIEVTVDGQACALLASGQSYRCSIESITADSQQVISENIQAENLGTFLVSTSFDSSNVSQRIDIFPGNQSVSDSRTVSQVSTAPTAPSSLNASAQTTGDIALTWNDNSSNEENFIVQRSSNDSEFSDIASLPANSNSYIDSFTNLQAGTAYTYRVSAINTLGANVSNQSTATALTRTVSSNSPTNEVEDTSSGGGGGAFYILTALLLFTRIIKVFRLRVLFKKNK